MKADRRKDRHRDKQTQIQPDTKTSTKTDSQTQRHTQRHTQRQTQRQTEEARQLHVIALFVYFVSCLLSFPSCYSFLSYFFAGVDPIPDPLFPCRASKQPPSSLPSLDDPIPFALDPIVSLPLGPLRKRKYLTDVVAVREGEIGLEDGRAKARNACRDSFCRAQTIYSYRTLSPCPFMRVTKICSSLTFRQFFAVY